MSFFSKKPKKNKIYTLSEAMNLVSKNEGFSVVQEENGFKVIPDKMAREHINRYRSQIKQREDFVRSLQTGYTPNPMEYDKNTDSMQRYGYHEEER